MIHFHNFTVSLRRFVLSEFAFACASLLMLAPAALAGANDQQAVDAKTATPPSASVPAADASAEELSGWHTQITNVTQRHPSFTSPYSGVNSLTANGRTEETTDLTFYAGLRLGRGVELWINPEIDQGFGLSNTVGMAGFPSGEAYKVGANTPYLRVPRVFLRQVISLGGDRISVDAAANQLAGYKTANNVTLTVGKFSVTDVFDTNAYAHDPRGDFLNWSIIDAGAFDYAADAWGFTYGAAAEWARNAWTVRAGAFQLSSVPNGKITSIDFSQFMLVGELERRYQLHGHGGKIKLLGFANRGRMGAYSDALQLGRQTGDIPDTGLVRRWSTRAGGAINLEQELSADLGVFLRTGVNQGDKEAYEFTEINRTISGGVALKGNRWGRPDDVVGFAGVVNGLSNDARRYFSAGGIGILIGDGQQRYGSERIFETYYSARLNPHVNLAVDYQRAINPAYNLDRGPVSIFAVRSHLEF